MRKLFGVALVVLGVLLVLNNMFDIDFDWDYVWPALFIIFGIYLIRRAFTGGDAGKNSCECSAQLFGDYQSELKGEFNDSSISHFIGDVDLDITGIELKTGLNNLNISAFIGDVLLLVNSDMAIELNCSLAFGDVKAFGESKGGIFSSNNTRTSGYEGAEKKLRISCSTMFGDVRVKTV